MIAIIDYNAGNMLSVQNALSRLGAEFVVTSNSKEILSADRVIFPGVGDAHYAMSELNSRGLVEVVRGVTSPLLGICLGMQLLCQSTEEGGGTPALGIFPVSVKLLKSKTNNKVPNIGWSEILSPKTELFDGVNEGDFVYYVHSYAVPVGESTICQSQHSESFSGAIHIDNFYGCQFHPEKSGRVGEQILRNFITKI